ncbi:hypothetical protein ACRAWD_26615 [Caulobacter segnis]
MTLAEGEAATRAIAAAHVIQVICRVCGSRNGLDRDHGQGRLMRIVETAVYRGPHFYSTQPMIRIRLDLGALEDWPTSRLPPHFVDRLLLALPGLDTHGCSYHAPGGCSCGGWRRHGLATSSSMSRWSTRP